MPATPISGSATASGLGALLVLGLLLLRLAPGLGRQLLLALLQRHHRGMLLVHVGAIHGVRIVRIAPTSPRLQ
ncbi:hypothetical protein XthCFBP4691_18620 [Xanthomonas theicola]|uniref:Uncharacterized protein n=1 Tax=Xanthomonas theicola TaxID=56464 RepID=A0A2S6ZAQ7_9XANT|nr:hypothetical protein XthCFBP4691_18620 [Xanthomonas theicola]